MNRIKELREEKGIRQIDFAKILNVSQGTLSNWERAVHDPDNETLLKIANFFDTNISYLVGETDDPLSQNKKEPSLNEKAQAAYDMLKKAGLNPDVMTDEDFESVLLFIRTNKDLIRSYSIALARGEKIGE